MITKLFTPRIPDQNYTDGFVLQFNPDRTTGQNTHASSFVGVFSAQIPLMVLQLKKNHMNQKVFSPQTTTANRAVVTLHDEELMKCKASF